MNSRTTALGRNWRRFTGGRSPEKADVCTGRMPVLRGGRHELNLPVAGAVELVGGFAGVGVDDADLGAVGGEAEVGEAVHRPREPRAGGIVVVKHAVQAFSAAAGD